MNRNSELDQSLRDAGEIIAFCRELERALPLSETCQDNVPQGDRLAAWQVQGDIKILL